MRESSAARNETLRALPESNIWSESSRGMGTSYRITNSDSVHWKQMLGTSIRDFAIKHALVADAIVIGGSAGLLYGIWALTLMGWSLFR